MATSNSDLIQFQIAKIETTQFAILQEEVNESELSITASFGFGVDGEVKIIRSLFEYNLLSANNPVLKIEAAVQFALEPQCFKDKINKEDSWVIPKGFAQHLAMTTVSVTRGILHEKTRNSPLNNLPLPVINVAESVNNDIIIAKGNPEKNTEE